MEITKKEFEAYEFVRESGVTNMFDIKIVSTLSYLTREQILYIMKNYDEICKKYPGVRKED